jgi:hypothetical protein
LKFLKSFGAFWYDFIIGDDWKIAVAVVLALTLLVGVMSLNLFGDAGLAVLGGVAIVAAFAATIAIDVRLKSKKD